jgi:hypothetical protein
MFWWAVLIALVLFFVWAAWRLSRRSDDGRGPESRDGRHGSRGSYFTGG